MVASPNYIANMHICLERGALKPLRVPIVHLGPTRKAHRVGLSVLASLMCESWNQVLEWLPELTPLRTCPGENWGSLQEDQVPLEGCCHRRSTMLENECHSRTHSGTLPLCGTKEGDWP